ncbi:hypothetical protein NMY22_g12767 [Coprinellus aureogranulatus]|nr:hypothetical protein NMY22_g12767 [Coprinellus aureogranulatus]
MLFPSFKHALLALGTLLLVKLAFAVPVPSNADGDLVEREQADSLLVDRDSGFDDAALSLRAILEGLDVDTRSTFEDDDDLFARTVQISRTARKDIKAMAGGDKKKYRKLVNWHKDQARGAMNTHPHLTTAHRGTVMRGAHSGGTNPHEPIHITAKFHNAAGQRLGTVNPHNGRPTRSFHINTGGHPPGAHAPHIP